MLTEHKGQIVKKIMDLFYISNISVTKRPFFIKTRVKCHIISKKCKVMRLWVQLLCYETFFLIIFNLFLYLSLLPQIFFSFSNAPSFYGISKLLYIQRSKYAYWLYHRIMIKGYKKNNTIYFISRRHCV